MASSSSSKFNSYSKPAQDQVFINFRGVELRSNFVSHLNRGLKRNGINAFIDTDEDMGQHLNVLLERIECSKIALAIFSPRYTESDWCLKELARMNECREQEKLVVIPIFYKVEPSTVKKQRGEFGDKFRDLVERLDKETENKWTEALKSISLLTGFVLNEKSDEDDLIIRVVKEVTKALNNISRASSPNPPSPEGTDISLTVHQKKAESSCGIELRVKQLEETLSFGFEETTRTIGVVGMPGIGKTTLVNKLYEKSKNGFLSHVLIPDIHQTTKDYGLSYLPTILLEDLLKVKRPKFETVQAAHQGYKDQLLRTKALVVLDNVTDKAQLVAILGKRDWIKRGSKIVIATSDKSLIHGWVDDIYEVPRLSYKHSLQHFTHYAFGGQSNASSFSNLSKDFVHYTKGNPLALKVLGAELSGKDVSLWYSKLDALSQYHKGRERSSRKMPAQSSSEMLQSVWKESYDALTQQQKDTLLDISCFRSLDQDYVASLLESYGANSTDARTEIAELCNKFLITMSGGKIEMHDTLHMFCKELGQEASAPDGKGRRRLWDHHAIIDVLDNNKGASRIRSIFLDLADVNMKKSFHSHAFVQMSNMQYLKIYNTYCPQECDREITLIFSLRRLCLSRNEKICRLPENISQFSRLKWLDMKYCKSLTHLPKLPPNLQCLDAHGCNSLKTIAQPLAHAMATEHIHSTFIFTYCNELKQAAKEEIASYAQRKCQLLPSALKLCNKDLLPEILFSTCFPGAEIPSWFCHEAIGSKVQFESPQHWNYNKLSGIALCAVVSFPKCQDQTRTEQEHTNYLSVKFTCKAITGEEPCTQITWKVGSWIEQGNKLDEIEPDHVFIGYTSCLHLIKHLEDQHSSQCAPIVAFLEFSVTDESTIGEARFEVLKSGFSFVFEPDENKNPFPDENSVASPSNSDISCEAITITEIPRTNSCLMDQANGLMNHPRANGKTGEAHSYTTLQQG